MLTEIIDAYNSIAIIGLDKNTGKTTTLNSLIRSYGAGKRLGLTSIGRDGESTDLVTSTEKPKIYVFEGTVIATTDFCLAKSDISKEILMKTDIHTSIGDIVITRARSNGYVEIAGPSYNTELIKVISYLKEYSDKVLIDGALSRKSFASPSVAEATIISTGAAIDKTVMGLVNKTLHYYSLLTIDEIDDYIVKNILTSSSARVIVLDEELNETSLDIETALGSHDEILSMLDEHSRYIFIKGAVTDRIVGRLLKQYKSEKILNLVVEDGTKLFISSDNFSKLRRRNIKLLALDVINIVAITVNPSSPYSYKLDADELIFELSKKIKIKIVNIMGVKNEISE